MRTDLGGFETNFWAGNLDGLLQRLGDLDALDGRKFSVVLDCYQ